MLVNVQSMQVGHHVGDKAEHTADIVTPASQHVSIVMRSGCSASEILTSTVC